MKDQTKILRIDASARQTGSVSRDLTDKVIERYCGEGAIQITKRDVSLGLPHIDEAWVTANFTQIDKRGKDQQAALSLSDKLITELKDADMVVIGTPIYNFGLPSTLKAWIDLVARAGVTFRYTENGPIGLLERKRAIILVASGGTRVGSEFDFATPCLRHALNFIGITDVTIIVADALAENANEKIAEASKEIAVLQSKGSLT